MTAPSSLRWGILGAARINERMLPALLEARNARLIAIASRRPGGALDALNRWAPTATDVSTSDTPESLLLRDDIDAVYLPLANREHAEWTLKAIEHGKHVLCEKPMALRVADIAKIQAATEKHRRKVMEGFMYRFHSQHARAKALVDSGLIGEVRSVRTSFSFMMKPARRYRIESPVEDGGGACWDIGCYAIHAARLWIPDPPRSLMASMHFSETGADLSTAGLIDFEQGRRIHFEFGFDTTRRSEYTLTGTEGRLTCSTVWQLPGDTPKLCWEREDGGSGVETPPAENHFVQEIEAFSAAVLEDREPPLSLQDALENCRILNAMILSAKTGRSVALSA